MIPDHIYLYVSKDPFLLDKGVTESQMREQFLEPLSQLNISHDRVSVFTTENIGSHRKLLPLLSQKWFEDCVIITIDDHEIYKKDAVSSLLKYYIASHRSAVVSLRAHRIALCMNSQPWKAAPYTINLKDKQWKGIPCIHSHPFGFGSIYLLVAGSSRLCNWPIAPPGVREMLLLPTGTGGVLYRPSFFHPIVFDRQLLNLTATGDDLTFRLATLARGVPVVTACSSDTLDFTCPIRPPSDVLSGQVRTLQQQQQLPRQLRGGAKKTTSTIEEVTPKEAEGYGPSLSTQFNNAGANNVMWAQAVRYLKSRGVLDLSALLQTFAGRERDHCQLLSALPSLGGDKGNSSGGGGGGGSSEARLKHFDIAVAAGELASSVAQHVYDKRCGLVTC